MAKKSTALDEDIQPEIPPTVDEDIQPEIPPTVDEDIQPEIPPTVVETELFTAPEHGDLTPEFVRWYLENKSAGEFFAKYADRMGKLPADVVTRLNEGRIV
jgi:hypothetical protein